MTDGAPAWWHWRNRRVRLADGATMTLADTPENQAEYPQPKSQKAGLGFPIFRMVVLLCLATGALLDAAIGPCVGKGSDEQTLLRSLLDTLLRGEILIGDAYYATDFWLSGNSAGYDILILHDLTKNWRAPSSLRPRHLSKLWTY